MILKDIQIKLGVTADGVFGPSTLKAAANYYKMNAFRAAHFFGQTSHESGNFTIFFENLNYSVDGLKKIFPHYFPGDTAAQYAFQPEKIANLVYADRMGNGAPGTGDGWKYRGRGAIQLTGKNNYASFSKQIGDDEIMNNPDLVATKYALESAIFFFSKLNLWTICDKGIDQNTINIITRFVNGGLNGINERTQKTIQYYNYLK